MSRTLERVAGAPITWGVCEVPGWGRQLAPERVLREMARVGLRASERGPEGYLPTDPHRLRRLLAVHDLELVGGFVPVVLHREDRLAEELARAADSAHLLVAAGANVLVLAAAIPADGYVRSAELDATEWKTLIRGIDHMIDIASERALTIALHPHYGTAIERPHHVQRLLETSPVPLCIDTGHLAIGGADPLEIARAAQERVAHVHLKDVDLDLADQVMTGRVGYRDAVRRGMYRPLGKGDVDVAEIVRLLERSGYRGWYVLEQDAVLETNPEEGAGPIRDAAASFEFLQKTYETETSTST